MSKNDYLPAVPRILVVEDEQVIAMDIEAQLVSFGCEVTGIASSGTEALRLAEATRPDVVLLDIKLQGPLDGFATAEEVQRKRMLPIVFVTAFSYREARRRALAIRSCGFLTKPYRPEDLRAAVSAAFARRNP